MAWLVEFHDDFKKEFLQFDEEVQDEIASEAKKLSEFGPTLGRPSVDTLSGSSHAKMKELRVRGLPQQEWRVAFAFDPQRRAILLVAGNKQGAQSSRFYRSLIKVADARFDEHLKTLEKN